MRAHVFISNTTSQTGLYKSATYRIYSIGRLNKPYSSTARAHFIGKEFLFIKIDVLAIVQILIGGIP